MTVFSKFSEVKSAFIYGIRGYASWTGVLGSALFATLVLWIGAGFFLGSCHLDGDLADGPPVNFTITVEDSLTGDPLSLVSIRILTDGGDTLYDSTDANGRLELATLRSEETRFKFTLEGYKVLDTLVEVPEDSLDSTLVEPVANVSFTVRLVPLKNILQNIRVTIRNEQLQPLVLGAVTYLDSLGDSVRVFDEDSNGIISVPNLKLPGSFLKVEHPGNLGKHVPISDSTSSLSVTLKALNQSLSGNVAVQAAGGQALAHEGARLVYILDDSLVVPRSFSTLSDDNGRFVLDSLPLVSGQLEYYLSTGSREPGTVVAVTTEMLRLAGDLKNVVLDPGGDSTGTPLVTGLPGDSLDADGGLVFRFNQAVAEGSIVVEVFLVNGGQQFTRWSLSGDATELTVSLADSVPWEEGLQYEYWLSAENAFGEPFTIPGSDNIRGFFYIRKEEVSAGTVRFPTDFRLAYFSSGTLSQFDSLDVMSSPLADSTSNMARLKWENPALGSEEVLVDSLSLYIKDTRNYTAWTLWMTFPVNRDSLALFFMDVYRTHDFAPPGKPMIPLLRPAPGDTAFSLKLVPKHGNRIYEDSATTLPSISQGMGSSIYALYPDADSLVTGTEAFVDTFSVTFVRQKNVDTSYARFDTTDFAPAIITDAETSQINRMTWVWDGEYSGRVIINFSDASLLRFATIRVDVGEGRLLSQPSGPNRPIWLRNKDEKVTVQTP